MVLTSLELVFKSAEKSKHLVLPKKRIITSDASSGSSSNSNKNMLEQQSAGLANPVKKGCSQFAAVLPNDQTELIRQWIKEDTPTFDVGGYVVGGKQEQAKLLMKSTGVICGVPWVYSTFEGVLGCQVEWVGPSEGEHIEVKEGEKILLAYVYGPARNILLGERLILNIMARASGLATRSKAASDIAKQVKWHGSVAGTRKVTPGFRNVEKYAMLVGGAATHRHDLSQMVMLKDNHIWSSGSITKAVKKARSACGFSSKIEVECGSLDDAEEAASAGAEVVMLDNMDPSVLKANAKILKHRYPALIVEASGNIRPHTLAPYLSPDVDVVSMSLQQGYGAVDFSLKIQPNASPRSKM